MRCDCTLQQRDLRAVVHDDLQVMARGLGQVSGIEDTLEQHDGRAYSRAAQRQGLVEPRDGEGVRVGEAARRGYQAMPIRIGLHHRHHAGARRCRTYTREVRAQRRGADLRADQPLHLRTPSANDSGRKFWKRVNWPWKVSLK